jgi:SNF2 family DNA or RNA helicase
MPSKTKTLERYFRIDDFYNPKSEIRERKHELTQVIRCYTIAKKTEDVLDLTESNDYIIRCPHPTALYDELLRDRVLNTIDYGGIHLPDYECVCDTPSLLRISLKEICCGMLTIKHIQTQHSEWFKLPTPKADELTKLIQRIPRGIIYFEFTKSIDDISMILDSLNKTYVVVDGHSSAKKSTTMIQSFKDGNVDYLVIQSKSGNAGLDLSNVNDIIFYALPDSFIVYEQCKHRIRRKGQTKDCNYYYLICDDTVEEKIYETLQRKKSFNDKVFTQLLKEK